MLADSRVLYTVDTRLTEVEAVQVEQSYRALGLALAGNLAVAILLAALLSTVIDWGTLSLWLLALVLVIAVRYASMVAFNRAPGHVRQERIWETDVLVGAGAAGIVWGSAAFLLFHPTSFMHQILVAFALGGMIAGAVPLLSFIKRGYYCFAVPIVVMICARNLSMGDETHFLMGLMLLIYGFSMLISASQMSRFLKIRWNFGLRSSRRLRPGRNSRKCCVSTR